MPTRVQCLLILTPREEFEKLSDSATKGYAFLPRTFWNHPACNLLTRNKITVVTSHEQVGPPRNASFEVIETLLDEKGIKELIRLFVVNGNADYLRQLLASSLHDIQIVTNFRRTKIIPAVIEETLPAIEHFLAYDLSYRDFDEGQLSFLKFAIEFDYEILGRFLIERGADVNGLEGSRGFTPLHLAAFWNSRNLGKILVQHGAAIEAKLKDEWNYTPLHLAVANNYPEMIQLLLESGADIEARDSRGCTPLHIAAESKCSKAMEYLLQCGANVNSILEDNPPSKARFPVVKGATPLLIAVCKKWVSGMKLLLKKGARVNGDETYAFRYAVENGSLEIVKCILKHRPSLKKNREAFRISLTKNGEHAKTIAERLIDYGFDVKRVDAQDLDFLFGAIRFNFLRVVRKLIAFGVDVNKFHRFSYFDAQSPLHFAAFCGTEEMAELLLEHGAQLNARRTGDPTKTPLFEAVRGKNANVVKLLVARNAFIGPDLLHMAVRDKCPSIVELLLVSGVDVHATTDVELNTPIHVAVVSDTDSKDVIKVLMNFGARFDARLLKICGCEDNLRNTLPFWFVDLSHMDKAFIDVALEFSDVFELHVIKIAAAFGLTFSPKNLFLEPFRHECEAELTAMKTETIGQTRISVYDVLMKGVRGCVHFSRYNSFERFFSTSSSASSRYPIYWSILLCHFQMGNLRRKLVETSLKFFQTFHSHFAALPQELKEQILSHLSNQDLKILEYKLSTVQCPVV